MPWFERRVEKQREVLQDEGCSATDFVDHVKQQTVWQSVAEQKVIRIRIEDLELD